MHASGVDLKGKQNYLSVGESKDLGIVKISVDGVFARLDELQQQEGIRLCELPITEKIRAVYQTIGSKPQAPQVAGTSVEGCKKVVD